MIKISIKNSQKKTTKQNFIINHSASKMMKLVKSTSKFEISLKSAAER